MSNILYLFVTQVSSLVKKLQELLRGDEIKAMSLIHGDVSTSWIDRVLDRLAYTYLVDILTEQRIKAHATINNRRQTITLYGKESDRKALEKRLKKYFTLAVNTMFREVDISSRSSGQKGLAMRMLVRQYGTWLEKLKEESGVDSITVDLKRGVLLVDGLDAAYEKLICKVEDCLKELAVSSNSLKDQMDKECGVCFCSPSEAGSKPYRLASCGHFFCLACLKEHLKQSGISKRFPITCPECDESIMLCDIKIVCPVDDERQNIFRAGLDAHVSQTPNGDIQFCPGPDCSMVYRRDNDGGTRECDECGMRMCVGCGEKPHPHDMSCAEFNAFKKPDDSLEMWMKQSGIDAKRCPNCKTPIEKNEGCNKMHCGRCHKSICWICLEFFDTSRPCYDHLVEAHGGIFDVPADIQYERPAAVGGQMRQAEVIRRVRRPVAAPVPVLPRPEPRVRPFVLVARPAVPVVRPAVPIARPAVPVARPAVVPRARPAAQIRVPRLEARPVEPPKPEKKCIIL